MAPALCMTQQYRLASMAAWFSSLSISNDLISPGSISAQSTAALSLGLSTSPKLQLPATVPSQGTSVPVQGMYGCGKDTLILIPFRLPQITCFSLSCKCFSSTQTIAVMCGSEPCFSSPTPGGRFSPANTPVVPPSSFILPSFSWVYIYQREGNGNPLQYSCLENPRDGRAWWAAVCGVAQSQT